MGDIGRRPLYSPGRGLTVRSMVLGIAALVFTFVIPIILIGWILAAAGILDAVAAGRQGNTGAMATAGLICSIVSLSTFAFFFIAVVAYLFTMSW